MFEFIGISVVVLSQIYLAWRLAIVVHNQGQIFKAIELLYKRHQIAAFLDSLESMGYDAPPPEAPRLTVVKPEKES